MSRRSWLVALSVVAHACVLLLVIVASVMATGIIPTPFDRVTFEMDHAIKVADIRLPAAHPPARSPSHTTDAVAAAVTLPADREPELTPTAAPDTIGPGNNASAGSGNAAVAEPPTGTGVMPGTSISQVEMPPAPASVKPYTVGGNIRPPTKVTNVDPVYPVMARAARVEGIVILQTEIATDGRVEGVTVLKSIPLLDQAAVDAVRQWRFTPTLLNGVPVPVVMTVTVNFSLASR